MIVGVGADSMIACTQEFDERQERRRSQRRLRGHSEARRRGRYHPPRDLQSKAVRIDDGDGTIFAV